LGRSAIAKNKKLYADSTRKRQTSQAVCLKVRKKCIFGRRNCRWQSDIKLYLRDTRYGDMERTRKAHTYNKSKTEHFICYRLYVTLLTPLLTAVRNIYKLNSFQFEI
jgi:hypothetical protein